MTWIGVAFDTCLLRDLEKGDDEVVLTRLEVLIRIRTAMNKGHLKMLLDVERYILKEYYRNIPKGSLARKFFALAIQKSAVSYQRARPENRCLEALARDGFDPADLAFVAVAQAVSGIYVTTEEKHLDPKRKIILSKYCGVTVMEFEELLSVLK